MPRVISYCQNCGRVLPLWRIRCFYCRGSALNWLHLIVAAALILPTIFLVIKLF